MDVSEEFWEEFFQPLEADTVHPQLLPEAQGDEEWAMIGYDWADCIQIIRDYENQQRQ